jgi:mannitol/fructose-specific phosphotransferase system IIA component (Ntr-type)
MTINTPERFRAPNPETSMPDLAAMISEDRIADLKAETKEEALRELARLMARSEAVSDGEALLRAVLEREQVLSTGVGIGVAVPHAMIPEVSDFVIAIGRSHKGIDFDALDEKPVFIVVMIAASDTRARGEYLKVLARLMQKLRSREFRRQIMFARAPGDIRDAFLARITEEQ